MKKLMIIPVLLLFSFIHAQDYIVLSVKGNIVQKSSGTTLAPKQKLNANEQVVFKSKDASAWVFSAGKGRFLLSPDQAKAGAGDEFLAYVKNSIVPGNAALATRAASRINNRIDLTNYFGRETVLILGTEKILMNQEAFPMNVNRFFFIRYNYDGQEVNKKLLFSGDTLFLNREHLLNVDGEHVTPEQITGTTLYYYHADEKKSEQISEVNLVMPEDEEVKEQLNVMVEMMQDYGAADEDIAKEIEGYLQEVYGIPGKGNLEEWLQFHYGIKTH